MKTLNTYFLLILSIAITVGCNSSGNGEHSDEFGSIPPQALEFERSSLIVPTNDLRFANTSCSQNFNSLSEDQKSRCERVITELCSDIDARSEDIEPVSNWRPIGVPSNYFEYLRSTAKRKNHFACSIYSFLHESYSTLLSERKMLVDILNIDPSRRDHGQDNFILTTAKKYGVSDLNARNSKEELLKRVDVIPIGFIMAIGAEESGWGRTGRLAKAATNIFSRKTLKKYCTVGVTCIKALNAEDYSIKFSSLMESVDEQFTYLNRHRSYFKLRDLRAQYRERGIQLSAYSYAPTLQFINGEGKLRGYSTNPNYPNNLRKILRNYTSWEKYDVFDRYISPTGSGLGI